MWFKYPTLIPEKVIIEVLKINNFCKTQKLTFKCVGPDFSFGYFKIFKVSSGSLYVMDFLVPEPVAFGLVLVLGLRY